LTLPISGTVSTASKNGLNSGNAFHPLPIIAFSSLKTR
jgi:hypothetical protein